MEMERTTWAHHFAVSILPLRLPCDFPPIPSGSTGAALSPPTPRPMASPPTSSEARQTGSCGVCGGWRLAAFFTSREAPRALPLPPPKKTMSSSVCNCMCVADSVNIHLLSVHNQRKRLRNTGLLAASILHIVNSVNGSSLRFLRHSTEFSSIANLEHLK